jgi:hypothetical protein
VEPGRDRLLDCLWLAMPNSRPLQAGDALARQGGGGTAMHFAMERSDATDILIPVDARLPGYHGTGEQTSVTAATKVK